MLADVAQNLLDRLMADYKPSKWPPAAVAAAVTDLLSEPDRRNWRMMRLSARTTASRPLITCSSACNSMADKYAWKSPGNERKSHGAIVSHILII